MEIGNAEKSHGKCYAGKVAREREKRVGTVYVLIETKKYNSNEFLRRESGPD